MMPLGVMARSAQLRGLLVILLALTTSCERRPRAREREAARAKLQARTEAEAAARRAAEPLPEESPPELLRVPHSGLPCKVDEVFANKCRRCHTIPARHAAPMVFLTWNDTREDRLGLPLYAVIGRAVRTTYMPYRIEANPPVQPLTDAERQIILDWVDAGAPREDCDAAEPSASGQKKPPTAKMHAAASPSQQPRQGP